MLKFYRYLETMFSVCRKEYNEHAYFAPNLDVFHNMYATEDLMYWLIWINHHDDVEDFSMTWIWTIILANGTRGWKDLSLIAAEVDIYVSRRECTSKRAETIPLSRYATWRINRRLCIVLEHNKLSSSGTDIDYFFRTHASKTLCNVPHLFTPQNYLLVKSRTNASTPTSPLRVNRVPFNA